MVKSADSSAKYGQKPIPNFPYTRAPVAVFPRDQARCPRVAGTD